MAGVDKNSNIIDFPDGQLGWNGDNMAFHLGTQPDQISNLFYMHILFQIQKMMSQ